MIIPLLALCVGPMTLWSVLYIYMIIPLMAFYGTDDLMASALSLHDNTSDGIVWDRRPYDQCSIST